MGILFVPLQSTFYALLPGMFVGTYHAGICKKQIIVDIKKVTYYAIIGYMHAESLAKAELLQPMGQTLSDRPQYTQWFLNSSC